MSFSGEIREEIGTIYSSPRHCQLAELAALFTFGGKLRWEDGKLFEMRFQTENEFVARKCFTLTNKTFKIYLGVTIRRNPAQHGSTQYILFTKHPNQAKMLFDALKLLEDGTVSDLLIKNSCCKRAYLRGVYLVAGSMSDPLKGYHLEMVCNRQEQAQQLADILQGFDLDAKIVLRKKNHVVYLKEGENVSDFLNIVEAHRALLNFENTRIYKDMRNRVNRKVNCEAANINKTVSAATRQVEDIRFIQKQCGLEKLPALLQEIASVRLENPDSSLIELGKLLDPPVGKSGVNHRLRKLEEFANSLRGN